LALLLLRLCLALLSLTLLSLTLLFLTLLFLTLRLSLTLLSRQSLTLLFLALRLSRALFVRAPLVRALFVRALLFLALSFKPPLLFARLIAFPLRAHYFFAAQALIFLPFPCQTFGLHTPAVAFRRHTLTFQPPVPLVGVTTLLGALVVGIVVVVAVIIIIVAAGVATLIRGKIHSDAAGQRQGRHHEYQDSCLIPSGHSSPPRTVALLRSIRRPPIASACARYLKAPAVSTHFWPAADACPSRGITARC
jgi:hypothetical protein